MAQCLILFHWAGQLISSAAFTPQYFLVLFSVLFLNASFVLFFNMSRRSYSYLLIPLILSSAFIFFLYPQFPLWYHALSPLFILLDRLQQKLFFSCLHPLNGDREGPYLVLGAGEAGREILEDLEKKNSLARVRAVLDDRFPQVADTLMGVPVVGKIDRLEDCVRRYRIRQVIVSIDQIPGERIKSIIDHLDLKRVRLRIVPSGVEKKKRERITFEETREIRAEDLLGRKPVELNHELILNELKDKSIFITGAGGSIGSELCLQLLRFPVKRLLCLCRSEHSLYQLQEKLNPVRLRDPDSPQVLYYIGDIRDPDRLNEIFSKEAIDLLYHAAAHKHVPFMEQNEKEAIKNNVLGTRNVLEASVHCGVGKFVLISTDKAVNPTSIMGASKRLAELLTAYYHKKFNLPTALVRFGNVLGSRGSVVPLFQKQILAGGPITVTDPRVIRYFMTIPEAALLVINCAALSRGGELFLLDMGEPVKIDDLVRRMIRLYGLQPDEDIKIVYTGLRPGEKLYEELLTQTENLSRTPNKKIYTFHDEYFGQSDIWNWLQMIEKNLGADSDLNLRQSIKEIIPEYSGS